jgi:hypothetical protein
LIQTQNSSVANKKIKFHKDKDIIAKITDMKETYEKTQKKLNDAEREDAEAQLKIEMLV